MSKGEVVRSAPTVASSLATLQPWQPRTQSQATSVTTLEVTAHRIATLDAEPSELGRLFSSARQRPRCQSVPPSWGGTIDSWSAPMPETLGARAGPSPCTVVGEPMGADSSASGASSSPLATQAKEAPNSITTGYDRVARVNGTSVGSMAAHASRLRRVLRWWYAGLIAENGTAIRLTFLTKNTRVLERACAA